MNSTVYQRLKEAVDYLKKNRYIFNDTDFAEQIGKQKSYVSECISGKRKISEKFVQSIIDVFPFINEGYIYVGTGDLIDTDIEIDSGIKPSCRPCYDDVSNSDNPQETEKLIPFYDNVSTIGGINELSASIDAVSQPTEYINPGDWFRGATAAIRHYGDSMVEYPPGCILAIKEVYDRELIIPGRDYVIETSEYRVTKRIQRGKDLSHITAYSTNPETYADGRLIHEPFDIAWQSIIRVFSVLGYVVKKMEK